MKSSKADMTGVQDTLMFREAAEAGAAVCLQRAENRAAVADLARTLAAGKPSLLLTCARGSSDHAATFAKYLIETRLGIPVASYAPSLASLYQSPMPGLAGQVLLLISQSGRSPDLLLSAEAARRAGALTVALVNDAASPLAAAVDAVVPLHAGPETSVAATKSYIATLAALVDLVAAWADQRDLLDALERLPDDLEAAWHVEWEIPQAFASARNLFVLGRGLTLGVAAEAALKFKECCAIHGEAFSLAEVAHGPMALVGPGFPLLVFPPFDEARAGADALLADFAARGADIAVAGEGFASTHPLPVAAGLHPATAPIAMIQSFYRFANRLSLMRGLDPDRPPSLAKVTKTR
ncbi:MULTISPECIES: SIS domain-containing protein [Sphingopyxis]|nr:MULTISPECIES: SIS domain-containing protein [Sphingopyxis]